MPGCVECERRDSPCAAHDPMRYPCPTCHVNAGAVCTSVNTLPAGTPLRVVHHARWMEVVNA